MSHSSPGPELLIHQARAGDAAALGRLLELYRNYLRLLARSLDRPGPAAAARPLRPGPGDVPRGPPRLPPVRRRRRARAGRLAAADPGPQPGRPGRGTIAPAGRDDRRQESLEAMLDRSGTRCTQALAGAALQPSAGGPPRAGGPAGRRPGRPAGRLPRGDHPAEPRAPPLRRGRGADGPLGGGGADALGPGAGAAGPTSWRSVRMNDEATPPAGGAGPDSDGRRMPSWRGSSTPTWPRSRPAGPSTPSGCWPSTRRSPSGCAPASGSLRLVEHAAGALGDRRSRRLASIRRAPGGGWATSASSARSAAAAWASSTRPSRSRSAAGWR